MSGEKKKWPGPPPGVSTTDGEGGHVPVNSPAAKPPARAGGGRRRQVGEDILKNVEQLRREGQDTGFTPEGVQGVRRDVRIGKMPKTRRSRRNHTSFMSVDGREYTFRTHDTKGNELPHFRTQLLYICIRELSLGGSALPVLNAFNFHFKDEDGQQFLPVPEELLLALEGDDSVSDPDQSEYALGTEG